MMPIALILARYWRECLIGVLVAALLATLAIDRVRLHRCEARTTAAIAALDRTKVDYRAAQAQAAVDNLTHVRAVEQANAATTQEVQDDLTSKLAAARVAGAAYAARLRDQAGVARGVASPTGVPRQADAAGSVADANRASLLDADIRICSDNTVKAEGWASWYAALR